MLGLTVFQLQKSYSLPPMAEFTHAEIYHVGSMPGGV